MRLALMQLRPSVPVQGFPPSIGVARFGARPPRDGGLLPARPSEFSRAVAITAADVTRS